jgi:hypothetical protein
LHQSLERLFHLMSYEENSSRVPSVLERILAPLDEEPEEQLSMGLSQGLSQEPQSSQKSESESGAEEQPGSQSVSLWTGRIWNGKPELVVEPLGQGPGDDEFLSPSEEAPLTKTESGAEEEAPLTRMTSSGHSLAEETGIEPIEYAATYNEKYSAWMAMSNKGDTWMNFGYDGSTTGPEKGPPEIETKDAWVPAVALACINAAKKRRKIEQLAASAGAASSESQIL